MAVTKPTPQNTPERRSRHRIPVDTAAKLRQPDGTELEARIRDLSTSGIFLYSEAVLEVGSKLEMVITLPASLGLGPGGWALCQASVVRLEEKSGRGVGVAAVLDRVELLPQIS